MAYWHSCNILWWLWPAKFTQCRLFGCTKMLCVGRYSHKDVKLFFFFSVYLAARNPWIQLLLCGFAPVFCNHKSMSKPPNPHKSSSTLDKDKIFQEECNQQDRSQPCFFLLLGASQLDLICQAGLENLKGEMLSWYLKIQQWFTHWPPIITHPVVIWKTCWATSTKENTFSYRFENHWPCVTRLFDGAVGVYSIWKLEDSSNFFHGFWVVNLTDFCH